MSEKLAKVRVQIVDEKTKLPIENVDVLTSAEAVYFPDGETFQEKWEKGDFKGDSGEDGAAATVKVGETITINPGSKAIVENVGTKHAAVLNFAIPKGEKGEDGTSIKILGRFETYEELIAVYPDGIAEDGGFMIGPEGGPCDYYFWNKRTLLWESIGSIQGPQGEIGEKGDPGEDGKGLSIRTTFPNYAKLVETYPDGTVCNGAGCVTLDTREYWYWDTLKLKWVSVGCIIGTKGDKGDTGTIQVGTVETGSAGESASVTNVGSSTDAVFNFVIPKGEKGEFAEVDNELNPSSNNPISNKAVADAIKSSLDEKADANHTHNYAGSSSAGGPADSALSCTGNAASATKATQDSAGQQINTTYIKGISISGRNVTVTKGNGTTSTLTTQDTIYTLPKATTTTLGGVTIDSSSLTVDSNGKIGVDIDKIRSSMGGGIYLYRASSTIGVLEIYCPTTYNGVNVKSGLYIANKSTSASSNFGNSNDAVVCGGLAPGESLALSPNGGGAFYNYTCYVFVLV